MVPAIAGELLGLLVMKLEKWLDCEIDTMHVFFILLIGLVGFCGNFNVS